MSKLIGLIPICLVIPYACPIFASDWVAIMFDSFMFGFHGLALIKLIFPITKLCVKNIINLVLDHLQPVLVFISEYFPLLSGPDLVGRKIRKIDVSFRSSNAEHSAALITTKYKLGLSCAKLSSSWLQAYSASD